MSNTNNRSPLDPDWVRLLKEAREMGLTVQEIRIYFTYETEKTDKTRGVQVD